MHHALKLPSLLLLTGFSGATLATSAEAPAYGPELQGYTYPFPVEHYALTSQNQPLSMAYIDVKPDHPNGRAVVLLHGKNFCAATWEPTIRVLAAQGFRVVAPDQIGFCKSSKPQVFQFSFRELAADTQALLGSLHIEKAIVVGHSTGGMLAIRYALTYPEAVEKLVLVDPIGLEDWAAKGVPPISVDQWYARDLKTDAASIRRYEQATYYGGTWDDRYQGAVNMLAGMYAGPGKATVAWDSALLYDMIMTQPVVYDLPRLTVPTLLVIGDKDTTAIGKDFAPPSVRDTLGHYPDLGKAAAAAIPCATLVEFPALGHAPQMQDPEVFHRTLLSFLAAKGTAPLPLTDGQCRP